MQRKWGNLWFSRYGNHSNPDFFVDILCESYHNKYQTLKIIKLESDDRKRRERLYGLSKTQKIFEGEISTFERDFFSRLHHLSFHPMLL